MNWKRLGLRLSMSAMMLVGFMLVGCKDKKESKADDGSSEAEKPKAAKVDPGCPQCECKDDKKIVTTAKSHQYCELKKPTKVQGYDVKAARVGFTKDGHIVSFSLAKAAQIGPVKCKKNGSVTLFKPGILKSCYTAETVDLGGVQCTGSITLKRDTNTLSRCKTAKAKKFGELEIPKGSWVTLYKDSDKLDRFEVSKTIEVQGHKCKGYTNYLYESGKLRKCNLAEDSKIEGKEYKQKDSVCFDEEAKVTDCSKLRFRMTG